MGEVYEAYDSDKGRTVALKILSDQYAEDERFRGRFLRESRSAAMLQEPHVVPIHDWGEIDGKLYIDMRLVQGQTLHELISKGPLAPERAVSIVQQIAEALDAAHTSGLIHRDVKPQNIIVTPADFAYLVDFGIAEMQGDARLTMAGTQIGSFAYMAPERFNDESCGPTADVYSLACVLYEAVTGDAPFRPDSIERLIASHISAPPPRASAVNPRVPAAVDDVIARGMAKEPDDRYGSAGALGRAAKRALLGTGPVELPNANTMAAPVGYAPTGGAPSPADSAGSTTGPTVVLGQEGNTGRQWIVPLTVVGIVGAILLAAIGVVIGLLVSQNNNSGQSTPTALPTPPSTQAQLPSVVTSTVGPSFSSAPPPPPSPTAVPPPTTDPEASSVQQLRAIASEDHYVVSTEANNLWVPQLSSKRPGVYDEGHFWNNSQTLQEHLRLRQQYGAKLLWSGDWSTFDAGNFWVTIAPYTFPTSAGALNWCTSNGFDSDHCYAKLVSTTRGASGTTAHN